MRTWGVVMLVVSLVVVFCIGLAATLIYHRRNYLHPDYAKQIYRPVVTLEADGQLKLISQASESKYNHSLRVPARHLLDGYTLTVRPDHTYVAVTLPTQSTPFVCRGKRPPNEAQPPTDPPFSVNADPYHDFARGKVTIQDHVSKTEHQLLSCFHEEGALFGSSVAMSDDRRHLLIGAQGTPLDRAEGSVVLLARASEEAQYQVQHILRSPHATAQGLFGSRLCFVPPYFLVTAPYERDTFHPHQFGRVYLYHWDGTAVSHLHTFACENRRRHFGIDASLARLHDALWEVLVLVTSETHTLQHVEVACWQVELHGADPVHLAAKRTLMQIS